MKQEFYFKFVTIFNDPSIWTWELWSNKPATLAGHPVPICKGRYFGSKELAKENAQEFKRLVSSIK